MVQNRLHSGLKLHEIDAFLLETYFSFPMSPGASARMNERSAREASSAEQANK